MDEEWWLTCTDPQKMLEFLRGKPRERKLRLFCCACVRLSWHWLGDGPASKALAVAERFADGKATRTQMAAAGNAARDDGWELARVAALRTTRDMNELWQLPHEVVEGAAGWVRFDQRDSIREATRERQCSLLHDFFGPLLFREVRIDSAWLSWNNGIVAHLAQATYDDRILPAGTLDNTRLLILADALEEAGCTDEQILTHLRGGEHYRGCWVIDSLLGKN